MIEIHKKRKHIMGSHASEVRPTVQEGSFPSKISVEPLRFEIYIQPIQSFGVTTLINLKAMTLVKGASSRDHKANQSRLRPEPMERVRFEEVVVDQNSLAVAGVPREVIAKLSPPRKYRFRSDESDERDDGDGSSIATSAWRPVGCIGAIAQPVGLCSVSTSWRSWYTGNASNEWTHEIRNAASVSALVEQRHRSASTQSWHYQAPSPSYPRASHYTSWQWPRRTSPSATRPYAQHHSHTSSGQERTRVIVGDSPNTTISTGRMHLLVASIEESPKPLIVVDKVSLPSTQDKVKFSEPNKRSISPMYRGATKRAKGFDKLELLCTATLEIGPLQSNPAGCSCPKSKCIALYCDCFKVGRRCGTMCSCLGCENTIDQSGKNGARTKAIRSILALNPRAFVTAGISNIVQKLPPGEVACNCVRSRCLKLYCSCYQSGKVCNEMVCSCVSCLNTEKDTDGQRRVAILATLEKRPDAFRARIKVAGLGCACKNNRCIRKYCECYRNKLGCTEKCNCRDCENDHNCVGI